MTSPPNKLARGGRSSPLSTDVERGGESVAGRKNGSSGRIQARARALRKEATSAEMDAWEMLRDRRCLGLKFRRQYPLAGRVVDFFCAELFVVIELEGDVHEEPDQKQYDEVRAKMLLNRGLKVLRIRNEDLSIERLTALLKPLLAPPLHVSGEGEISAPTVARGGGEVER